MEAVIKASGSGQFDSELVNDPVFQTPHSTDWHREVAETNTILLTEVGSTMHGVTVKEADDIDEMGICIPPSEIALGVGKTDAQLFEQYEFRTQAVGDRSGPGDIDRTIYSLRKYVRMAASGSPTVQMPLFVQRDMIRSINWAGEDLRAHRDMFLSKQSGYRFRGYLLRQRSYLDGTLAERVHRPELIAAHGYDTKYAYHALRLALQGCELLNDHVIHLPMKQTNRDYLLGVREGRYSLAQALAQLDVFTSQLEVATERSKLPEFPDYERINDWLANTYRQYWDSLL